jgi:hypothetical protein
MRCLSRQGNNGFIYVLIVLYLYCSIFCLIVFQPVPKPCSRCIKTVHFQERFNNKKIDCQSPETLAFYKQAVKCLN